MFKVGDRVEVINDDVVFVKAVEFIKENINDETKDFKNGMDIRNGTRGVINAIEYKNRELIAIVNTDTYSFVIEVSGLEKIDNEISVNLDIKNIIKEERYYIETNLGKFDVTTQINELLKNK